MVMMAGGDSADRDRILAMMEIDRSTRLGSEAIKLNQLSKAVDYLHCAYKLSRQLNDDVTERACAFNIGAAYITFRDPEKGLEYLQRAVPPMNRRDGISNGDLFQNFALGYEMLDNESEMVRYFELALDEYRRENLGLGLEIAISVKLAKALANAGQYERSARIYGRLAEIYEKIGEHNNRAEALSKQMTQLATIGGSEYIQSLYKCMDVCELVYDQSLKCKLLEDLGLAFTQVKQYDKAVVCFERVLALAGKNDSNSFKERQAVALQNLGAVLNSQGAFQKAIGYHESAARIFGEIGKRKNQGHCFVNLAYAHARLGDMDSSGESYLHALLAARDTRDKKAEWQAAEGLAAVAFLRGQTEKAIQYYKQALNALSGLEGQAKCQERLVAKLTAALQAKVTTSVQASARSSVRGAPSELSLGPAAPPTTPAGRYDDPRTAVETPTVPSAAAQTNWAVGIPSTSQDTRASALAEEPEVEDRKRKESDVVLRINSLQRNISGEIVRSKVPMKRREGEERHYKFSLGIGEYDTDSDRSLSDDNRRSSVEVDKLSEEMDGMLQQFRDKQSDYSKKRPGTARNDRRGDHVVESDGATSLTDGGDDSSETSDDDDTKRRGRRRDFDPALASARQDQSLINVGDSWESDREWKNQAAKFLVTGSATNSGTTVISELADWLTDSSSPNHAPLTGVRRKPAGRRVTYELESDEESIVTETDNSGQRQAHPAPPQAKPTAVKRPISKNLARRPIGKRNLSESDQPILERSEPIPETPKSGEIPKSAEIPVNADSPERLTEAPVEEPRPEENGRLSVDSEGITSLKNDPPRHLSAVMKLRESFVDETGSEADEHIYAEVEHKNSARDQAPVDPLVSTYEMPGNYLEPDRTTEFVDDQSESSYSSSDAEPLNEEEEALYDTIGAEEPSTSQTVFPSPSRTPRDESSYTGPMEAPPPPPLEDPEAPRMTVAERVKFRDEYLKKKDDLERSDSQEQPQQRMRMGGLGDDDDGTRRMTRELNVEEDPKRAPPLASAFCIIS